MSGISSPTRRELLAATAAVGAINMLPGTLHAAAGGNSIRPFTVSFPAGEIDRASPAHRRHALARAANWYPTQLLGGSGQPRRRKAKHKVCNSARCRNSSSTGERSTIGASARRI